MRLVCLLYALTHCFKSHLLHGIHSTWINIRKSRQITATFQNEWQPGHAITAATIMTTMPVQIKHMNKINMSMFDITASEGHPKINKSACGPFLDQKNNCSTYSDENDLVRFQKCYQNTMIFSRNFTHDNLYIFFSIHT